MLNIYLLNHLSNTLYLLILSITSFTSIIRITPSFLSKCCYYRNGLTIEEINSSDCIHDESALNIDIAKAYHEKSLHNEKLVQSLASHVYESFCYFTIGFYVTFFFYCIS